MLGVAGGASVITPQDLEQFDTTDIVRALRRVPGVSLQIEDGWALRLKSASAARPASAAAG